MSKYGFLLWQKMNVDIIHFPAFPPRYFMRKRFVFTVHGGSDWKYIHAYSWKGGFYMKPLIQLGMKRAKIVIADSENSKNDILAWINILWIKLSRLI